MLRSGPQTAISHVQTELLGRERGEMGGPSSNFPALMRDRGSASRLSARKRYMPFSVSNIVDARRDADVNYFGGFPLRVS